MDVKEVFIVSGLIGVQIIYGVYIVICHRILTIGLNPLFIVIVGSLVAAAILLPFAVVLERQKWPKKLGGTLLAQLALIALGGVTVVQSLTLMGNKKTSPSVASAMTNLVPGLIFIIAACLRFEKFELRCKYSIAKVLGAFVCLGGAMAISFLQSPQTSSSQPKLYAATLDKDWIIGCLYLLGSVFSLSCATVLQAATMVGFPAPFSLCVICALMASVFTIILQVFTEGKLDFGSPTIKLTKIAAFIVVGGAMTSLSLAFQTWCMKLKGPVFVTIFNPIQAVCAGIISSIILKQAISLGSLAGMLLMFIGLYIFLWAKKKESFDFVDDYAGDRPSSPDIEKPLLA